MLAVYSLRGQCLSVSATNPSDLDCFIVSPCPRLTSQTFISSISASVGALRRTRGLGGARSPPSDADRSIQDVDFTLQGQGRARQGMEPNAEGGKEGNHNNSHVNNQKGLDIDDLLLVIIS